MDKSPPPSEVIPDEEQKPLPLPADVQVAPSNQPVSLPAPSQELHPPPGLNDTHQSPKASTKHASLPHLEIVNAAPRAKRLSKVTSLPIPGKSRSSDSTIQGDQQPKKKRHVQPVDEQQNSKKVRREVQAEAMGDYRKTAVKDTAPIMGQPQASCRATSPIAKVKKRSKTHNTVRRAEKEAALALKAGLVLQVRVNSSLCKLYLKCSQTLY